MEDYKDLKAPISWYWEDADFSAYVDKYARKANITVEEALMHKIVQEYLSYLLDSRNS